MRRPRKYEPSERLLFGGVYGSVLACALAAVLYQKGGTPNPGFDALWALLTALASAAAHGQAHVIAHRVPEGGMVALSAARSMLAE